MLQEQKYMFKRGRLSLKDYWRFFVLSYRTNKRSVTQKIDKQENIREQISWFLIDIYFEYEYCWEPLTEEKISRLLLIDQSSTSRLLDKIESKIKKNSHLFVSPEAESL